MEPRNAGNAFNNDWLTHSQFTINNHVNVIETVNARFLTLAPCSTNTTMNGVWLSQHESRVPYTYICGCSLVAVARRNMFWWRVRCGRVERRESWVLRLEDMCGPDAINNSPLVWDLTNNVDFSFWKHRSYFHYFPCLLRGHVYWHVSLKRHGAEMKSWTHKRPGKRRIWNQSILSLYNII